MIRYLVTSIAFAVALSPLCQAQITIDDRVSPYEPMIAGCQCVIPDGAEVKMTWAIDGAGKLVIVGNQAYIWAPPGRYTVRNVVVWMKFREIDFNGETIRIQEDWDLQQFEKTFDVAIGDDPVPIPPGPPTPVPPVPVPPDVPDGKWGITKFAFIEASKIQQPHRAKAKEVASNFEAVAAGIAAGSFRTIQEATNELQGRNRVTLDAESGGDLVTAWMPWFKAWQVKVDALNASGDVRNMVTDYQTLFEETAAGLVRVQ